MAIDRAAIRLWRELADTHCLPTHPAVLEIGQANWFGDVDPEEIPELRGIAGLANLDYFQLAALYYSMVLDCKILDSVDGSGSGPCVHRHDLNRPLPAVGRFCMPYDIVINTGTCEHVFDQRQVFETIHDMARVGGLMVHAFPVAGCRDHGFYTYQPCLLEEIARANEYRTLAAVRAETNDDTVMHLAWEKTRGAPFRLPYQRDCDGVMGGKFRGVPA